MRAKKSYLVGENIPLDEFLLFWKGEVLWKATRAMTYPWFYWKDKELYDELYKVLVLGLSCIC